MMQRTRKLNNWVETKPSSAYGILMYNIKHVK